MTYRPPAFRTWLTGRHGTPEAPNDACARLLGLEPAPVELVRRGDRLFAIDHGGGRRGTAGPRLSSDGYAVHKVQADV
ncbi:MULTISPECIES: hypothetical protein [Streptosporangium]|uniref:Aminoglycoside phosphotransferase n=1 Tax=Streptosporangium brasiliense TaxID=47480 RepID=A0ABT9R0X1_9ACTN|nr:hypothetical protein [Streptosporangium brasiliense]MDP9862875.1 hypothetical protein [Streptosporangium brasiliense]